MFTHKQVWGAMDRLAREKGLSMSGLARKAGLDPTAFNPSKRHNADGRERWPSTETLSKVLTVTETTLEQFATLMRLQGWEQPRRRRKQP